MCEAKELTAKGHALKATLFSQGKVLLAQNLRLGLCAKPFLAKAQKSEYYRRMNNPKLVERVAEVIWEAQKEKGLPKWKKLHPEADRRLKNELRSMADAAITEVLQCTKQN